MRIGAFELTRTKTAAPNQFVTVFAPSTWWPVIREGFAGAWQRSIATTVEDAATHPTFWSCLTLIAGDIAKCRPKLVQEDADGICEEVDNPAYSPVIRRPNHYQNRIQFYTYWILSKLTRGNAYALKERDGRGVVVALYLLDPTRVRPMVTPSGDVYYACQQDVLAGLTEASLVIPASEIIHDSMNTLYHPLVGLSPIYAAGHAAMQGLTIMGNATRHFKNGSQVGGVLTAPGAISNETAQRIQQHWETNYAGEANIGKVAVLGDGLKFEKPSVMSAVDSQLIDQLKWDDEKICATLHVPPYMVSVGPLPSYNNVEALAQQYYGQALQILFESLELCLTEGLELNDPNYVEFDIDALDRMDSVQKMDVATKGVVGGVLSPNEARARFNKKPVKGGESPYLQQQNFSLEALSRRDQSAAAAPPAAPLLPPVVPEPKQIVVPSAQEIAAEVLREWRAKDGPVQDDLDQTDEAIAELDKAWEDAA